MSRVVLVFDADAGGEGGVDRALEVFVKSDLDLRVATLPEGLDPCDLIAAQGAEPFRQALESAIDVFEYKLQRAWAKHATGGLEGKRLAAEEMLGILALTPTERSVKLDLMVNRIAHRLLIKEETVWARLKELRNQKEAGPSPRMSEAIPGDTPMEEKESPAERSAPALPHERELVEVLLAEPALVGRAVVELPLDEVEHPGLRKVIEALYRLHALGQTADLDHLRAPLDNERLWERLQDLQFKGLDYPDRTDVFQKVLARFRGRRQQRRKHALMNQLQEAPDEASKVALLRQLRDLDNSESQKRGGTDGAA